MKKQLTGYEYGRQWWVFEREVERPTLYPFFVFMHAMSDGGPVLKGESSWRTICGVYFSRPTWRLLIQFRRFSKSRGVSPWVPRWLRCSHTSVGIDYGTYHVSSVTLHCLKWRWHRGSHSMSIRRSR